MAVCIQSLFLLPDYVVIHMCTNCAKQFLHFSANIVALQLTDLLTVSWPQSVMTTHPTLPTSPTKYNVKIFSVCIPLDAKSRYELNLLIFN